jgi:hypothetical protein
MFPISPNAVNGSVKKEHVDFLQVASFREKISGCQTSQVAEGGQAENVEKKTTASRGKGFDNEPHLRHGKQGLGVRDERTISFQPESRRRGTFKFQRAV